jgi:hypothetical protein
MMIVEYICTTLLYDAPINTYRTAFISVMRAWRYMQLYCHN